jgi:hypothetical protein
MYRLVVLGLFLLATPLTALADDDRVAFGASVQVRPGEVVRDAVAYGGDVVVEGVVTGDAVAFGGSVLLSEDARVHGDVSSFGGEVRDLRVEPLPSIGAAQDILYAPMGPLEGFWKWLGDASRGAVAHILLFLLGLLLVGLWRDRLRAMQLTMVHDGLKTAGIGLVAYVVCGIGLALLAISIVGIPIAVLLGMALPIATYVGLAAAATVLGAALPIAELRGREVLQLAAGVALLFVASLVPVVGTVATIAVACLGFGALVRTRFSPAPPADLPEVGGPYRTRASGA